MAKFIDRLLFPEIKVYPRDISLKTQLIFFVLGSSVLSLVGVLLPADGFFGFDWVLYFHGKEATYSYPPWLDIILYFFSWPTLIGVTVTSVGLAILKRSNHLISAIFALFTLPLFWTLFLGQIDGLVALGVSGLPWLVPLALLKPQVSAFACFARKSYLVAMLLFLLLSIIIWGFWPGKMISSLSYYAQYEQDIALKWWGIPIALILLWFSRGDVDMLMAAGAFGTLHLLPYNLLLLVPAIARLSPRSAAIACLFTWMPLSANWIGPGGWWMAWLFIIWLWWNLAYDRYRMKEGLLNNAH